MLYVINYADGEPYETYRRFNSKTAKWIGGANKVIEYSSHHIPQSYRNSHADIFSFKRGAGLWLWKPYIIKKTLDIIDEDDWVFYCDGSCFFISSITPLISYAEQKNMPIMLFGLPLLNRQFCKKECYAETNLKDNGENQALGTYMLIKKTSKSLEFVNEWLSWCERLELISPNKMNPNIDEFPDFFEHREDQSLLSLLRIKYDIPLNLECSNFKIFPYFYCYEEFIYKPLPLVKVPYGVVIINHRSINPIKYAIRFFIMLTLKKLNLLYTEQQVLRNKPSFRNNIKPKN